MTNIIFHQKIRSLSISLVAVLAALIVGLILVTLSTGNPDKALHAFFDGVAGNSYAIGASLNRAIVLMLVGMGFIFANRANLVNVGAEGQMAVGGIFATALALYGHVSGLPFDLPWILPMVAGAAAGAFWGGIAGVLKVRQGTNEVISTLLLVFIGLLLVYWSVQSESLLRQPQTNSTTLPQSEDLPDSTILPVMFSHSNSPLHVGLIIALVLAVILWVVLNKSELGLRLRAIGLNITASRRAGIAASREIILAMLVSGGLAGVAGAMMIQGDQQYLTNGFTSGYGFDGLVAGLLARNSIPGVILTSLFFGFLRSGGINMEMISGVPSAVVFVIQGLVVIFIAGASRFIDRRD